MELPAKNYIFTPFGGLFGTMYNINHGQFKLQIKEKNLQPSNIFKYTGIYLFTKVQKISRSPTITLIYPTTPPSIGIKQTPAN